MPLTHDEVRALAVDVLSGREPAAPDPQSHTNLMHGVACAAARRANPSQVISRNGPVINLQPEDQETFLRVFWELVHEGIIAPGMNRSNLEFPWFHITRFGRSLLDGEHSYSFHDVVTYAAVLQREVPGLHQITLLYLTEAMRAFTAGCTMSSVVMLGCAAEHVFLLVLDAAVASDQWKVRVKSANAERHAVGKMEKFNNVVMQNRGELPRAINESFAQWMSGFQTVVRINRNEAGHPTGKQVERDLVLNYLRMMVHYCKGMIELKDYFAALPPASV